MTIAASSTKSAGPKTRKSASTKAKASSSAAQLLVAGLDLGTNSTCVLAASAGRTKPEFDDVLPTLCGYVKEGIVTGVLPDDREVFFGEEALAHRLHLRLVQPLEDGIVDDVSAGRDFCQHLRTRIDPESESEVRAVIGVPANADTDARRKVAEVATGSFEAILLIPEPFLAALGVREEQKLGKGNYIDPVNNSLFIDIGAGTTDLCLIQGYYPTQNDQISVPFAGDTVDGMLSESIFKSFPDTHLSMLKIREIKEQHSYCGALDGPKHVKVIVGGKPRQLEVSEHILDACNALVETVHTKIIEIVSRISSDSVEETLQNIIVTGGGSQIQNIDKVLEQMLTEDGYESPKVRTVGSNYKELVARGAFKAAQQAKPNQWQHLVG
ncbi:MAG: rod shape-determining protein [Opitutales bacterium]